MNYTKTDSRGSSISHAQVSTQINSIHLKSAIQSHTHIQTDQHDAVSSKYHSNPEFLENSRLY